MPPTSRTGDRLTTRSVLASTLLGVNPPRLPIAALVAAGGLFGFNEGAVRTALSRMVRAGEAVAEGGHYRLVGALAERHRRQEDARLPRTIAWDGTWELALITAERRSATDRSAWRAAAADLRLAEVREGWWARPSNLDFERQPEAAAVVTTQGVRVRGGIPEATDALVAAFRAPSWADRARTLIDEMLVSQPGLDRSDPAVLPDTFLLNAAVIRHLLADPLLPDALAPASWPSTELRGAFQSFDEAFKRTWREWYRMARDGTTS